MLVLQCAPWQGLELATAVMLSPAYAATANNSSANTERITSFFMCFLLKGNRKLLSRESRPPWLKGESGAESPQKSSRWIVDRECFKCQCISKIMFTSEYINFRNNATLVPSYHL